jgi:tetratricopeptide (TPR) repeat protein
MAPRSKLRPILGTSCLLASLLTGAWPQERSTKGHSGGKPLSGSSSSRRPELNAQYRLRGSIIESLSLLAVLSAKASPPGQFRAYLEEASTITGDEPSLIVRVARAYLDSEDAPVSIEQMRLLLRKSPNYVPAHKLLADGLGRQRQLDSAIEELRKAVVLAPLDPELRYQLATAGLSAHDLTLARRHFAVLHRLRPVPATYVVIARAYLDADEYQDCERELRAGLARFSQTPHAHFTLGDMYLKKSGADELDRASQEFEAELKIVPREPAAELYLGIALGLQHKYDEAFPHLLSASESIPTSPDPWVYLTQAYWGKGQAHETIRAARQAIALTRNVDRHDFQIAQTHYILAQALRKTGESSEADREFEEARKLQVAASATSRERMGRYLEGSQSEREGSPQEHGSSLPLGELHARTAGLSDALARDYFHLAVIEAKLNQQTLALSHLRAAYKWNRASPEVGLALGSALYEAGQYQEAITMLSELATNGSANDRVRSLLGMSLFHENNFAEAAKWLITVASPDIPTSYCLAVSLLRTGQEETGKQALADLLTRHKDSADLQLLLGKAAMEERDFEAARTYFGRALQLDPNVAQAHLSIGTMLLRAGRLNEAETQLRAELRHHASDIRAQYYLAYALDLAQRHNEAEALLSSVLQARPDFPEAQYALGKILLQKGLHERALAHLLRATELRPDMAQTHYQLGLLYRKTGLGTKAEQEFSRFRELKEHRTAISAEEQP